MSEKELYVYGIGKNGGAADFNLHTKDYNEAKEKLKRFGRQWQIVKDNKIYYYG